MRKNIALFEIFIMIAAGFAVSYFIHESSALVPGKSVEDETVTWLREKILGYLSNGLVSAQEGLWTCLEGLNGTICQEYPSEICNDLCLEDCIPSKRSETRECQLGTCYDNLEGTCSAQSPKLACENSGGQWFEQEPAQCNPGCCLIGGNANYITEQACSVLENRLGISGEWQEVENELECLLLGEQQQDGACVLEEVEPGLYDCEFTTEANCISMGGEFNSGLLCTNPGLNTICTRTKETSCFESKDEVYFLDSCGNRANVYDTNKKANDDYWSRIYSKNESCSLDGSNQEGCGNCDYLLGSLCGTPGEDDEKPLEGEYVCRDLSCIDEWGAERKNGESWCAFDSAIGVQGDTKNKERSVDLPGSRHYRQVCVDGEVRTDPCQDFRNEVCQESRDEEIGFSSAACRINNWQSCIAANQDKTKLDRCEENSACFLKSVRISNFKFDVCAPKHSPGFDLKEEFGGEVGESICSAATQTCTVVEVKGFGGWDCEVNCDCLKPGFAETMNNLCISLGDCGGNVNIAGEFTDSGYSVKRSPKLRQNYISELQSYTEPVQGQKVDPLTEEETAALFGLDPNDPEFESKLANIIGGLGAGATGVVLAYYTYVFVNVGLTFTEVFGALGHQGFTFTSSFLNAAAGAAAGAAIGFLLGKLFGLEGDALLAVTILGAATGLFVSTGIPGLFNGVALFSYGWLLWTIIVIIIIILIFKFLGIGDTRTKKVAFTCMPWQPPLGGDSCEACTEGDLPCSKYKCQSLGQTCEFVNEGTGEEACIDIAPDDTLAPKISPNYEVISEDFEYTEVTSGSFKVEHKENECIPAYTQVTFGVSLDEHGQCKYDTEHTAEYDEMEFFFGESSLFKKNHVTALSLPSLESLGEFGFDPDRRADFDLFVRCQDGSGNKNENEFAIRFCISPENDITPPILQNFEPESPAYASLEAENMNMSFYTNEPAECRYSLTDKDYEQMENEISCNNDFEDYTLFGFECSANLPVSENETNYYFRCKDRPGQEERNTNNEGVEYKIIKTSEPLIIEEIRLNPEAEEGVISTGAQPVTVTLEVETSGGAPVNRYCTYGFGGDNDLARFFESGTDMHRQVFTSLFEGSYDIGIRCEDDTGNVAESGVQFEIDVDDIGPMITRVYSQGSRLTVITNEESMCYYSHNSCGFQIEGENVFEMSGSDLVHTTDFNSQINYYIKCQDGWGNTGSCTTARSGY